MNKFFLTILTFFLFILFNSCISTSDNSLEKKSSDSGFSNYESASEEIDTEDPLAADKKSALSRTGIADPLIDHIPENIENDVFKDPEANLPILVKFLVKNASNDFQKIKIIHDWITNNIAYDYNLFYGTGTGSRTVFEFLPLKRTTCGGFAALFQKMAFLAGFEAAVIPGFCKSYQFKNGEQGDHVWNGVKIEGKWYIVDTTYDSRIEYKNGKFSMKTGYSDASLFLNPKGKILVNYPQDEKYQFIDKKIKYKDFLSSLKLTMYFLKYGAAITDRSFAGIVSKTRVFNPERNQYEIDDVVNTNDNIFNLEISSPPNVQMDCSLKDLNNNKIENYYFSHAEGSRNYFSFSAPEKGIYRAFIYAKFDGKTSSEPIFDFKINFTGNHGPRLPLSGKLFKKHSFEKNKLNIINLRIPEKADNDYFMIDLEHPDGVEVFSAVEDEMGNRISNAVYPSIRGNRRTYYYSIPADKKCLIKVFSKLAEESNYTLAGILKAENNGTKGTVLPPGDLLIYHENFTGNGFSLVSDNLTSYQTNAICEIKVKCPEGFKMNCQLKNEKEENASGFYGYDFSGGIYTFYFSPPNSENCTAKIFQIDRSSIWNTILEVKISNKLKKGILLPPQGTMFMTKGFSDFNLELVSQNLNRWKESGFIKIGIKAPPDVDLIFFMFEENLKMTGAVNPADKEKEVRIFNISPPKKTKARIRLSAKYKNENSYKDYAAEFTVQND